MHSAQCFLPTSNTVVCITWKVGVIAVMFLSVFKMKWRDIFHYYSFSGLLPPVGIFAGWKIHFASKSCPIGSFTTWHLSSRRQPNRDARQRAPPTFGRAAITFDIGPHSSFSLFWVIAFLCSWCMLILHCSKFSYLHQPRFIVYFCGCSPGFDFVFSLLAKRLARKSMSEIIYFVSSHEWDVKPLPV